MRYGIAAIALFGSASVLAQPKIATQPISYQLSYEQYSMPSGIKPLGVLGLHGFVNFTPHWYAGMGVYGGVKGQSGGYFALSLDGGYTHPLYGPVWLDVGASVGAGGGRSTAVGGGLFVHPHAGLTWHHHHVNIGVNYSWMKFTDGDVDSKQIGVTLSFPTTMQLASFAASGDSVTVNQQMIDNSTPNYVSLLGQIYWPRKGTKNVHGQVSDQRTEFVGAEFGHFVSAHAFWFVNATGAFHGRGNGYANALFGAGWQYPLSNNQRWQINAKFGVGSGGGGDVDTGGGFIVEPMLGLEYRVSSHFALEADGSYLTAPEGDFDNWVATLALKYYFANQLHLGSQTSLHGWRVRLSHETYFKPRAKTGATNPTMQLMNLNLDYWFNRYLYASGQTAFAYDGQHTGGYFSGLVGPGVQYPLMRHVSVFAEALVGTAGGASLAIGNGAMWQMDAGMNYQFTPDIGAQVSVGRLNAFKGDFRSTVFNAGLSYRFSTL